ncbi:hypothetical protein Tco_0297140, partial [Tanacetum coccineum]
NHEAIEKYSKEIEMMAMVKVKENVLDVVIQGECSMPPKNNDQRAFIRGAWSDNGEDEMEKTKDSGCSKQMKYA